MSATAVVLAQTPSNDLCINAETLTCGLQTTGSSIGGTDTDTPTGCSVFANDLGVWYTFLGTGGDMTLSTCGPTTGGTNSLAYMALFAGADCGQINCVGDVGSNPGGVFCSFTSAASMAFSTLVGQTYYLFIAANAGNPSTIQFELTLVCSEVTGISESDEEPNLFSVVQNRLKFLISGKNEFQITDVVGKIHMAGNTTEPTIDLSSLPNGFYVISAWSEGRAQSLKTVLVNH